MKYSYHLLLILLALASINTVTFLEDTPSSYLEVTDPYSVTKIFKKDLKVWELKSFIEKRLNENFLVIKANEENSKSGGYIFEGTFNQILSYDPEWKVFKSTEQIFTKIIKNDISNEKFNISIEKTDMIFQFSLMIVDEAVPLKLKLTRDESTQTDNPDTSKLLDKIASLEGKIDLMESRMKRRETELYSYITNITISDTSGSLDRFEKLISLNGNVAEFKMDILNSSEIDVSIELDCKEAMSQVVGYLELKSSTGQKTVHKLFYQRKNLNYVNAKKSINILKGNYNATLNILAPKQAYYNSSTNKYYFDYNECFSLIVKQIEK